MYFIKTLKNILKVTGALMHWLSNVNMLLLATRAVFSAYQTAGKQQFFITVYSLYLLQSIKHV